MVSHTTRGTSCSWSRICAGGGLVGAGAAAVVVAEHDHHHVPVGAQLGRASSAPWPVLRFTAASTTTSRPGRAAGVLARGAEHHGVAEDQHAGGPLGRERRAAPAVPPAGPAPQAERAERAPAAAQRR